MGRNLWLLAITAALNLGLGACGRSWPEVKGVADPAFADQARAVRTVDVLPLDMQLWADQTVSIDPDRVVVNLETNVSHGVRDRLGKRGYQVVAAMGWDGSYYTPDFEPLQAMDPVAVVDTNYVLSTYGRANAQAGGALVTPYLPHRLGSATGSDATLYVGGWSYVGQDPNPVTTGKVIKGVLIGLLIVAVIVVIVIAAKEGGGGGGGVAKGIGKAASGVGKAAVRVASGMARGAARASGQLMRGTLQATGDIARVMAEASFDSYGHGNTHVTIPNGRVRPAYAEQADTPRTGRSQMYVEMTLVDNHTGVTLWHARQRFLANATKPDQVDAVIRQMLASMPQNRAGAARANVQVLHEAKSF